MLAPIQGIISIYDLQTLKRRKVLQASEVGSQVGPRALMSGIAECCATWSSRCTSLIKQWYCGAHCRS